MAEHQHAHGHPHGHGHGHGHGHDHWDGDEYLKKPNIDAIADSSVDNVFFALQRAGKKKEDLATLNLIEVGCGPGLVTARLAPSFATVHAIDVSPSMLATFSAQEVAALPNVTYAQHTLHAGSGDDFVRGTPAPSPTKTDPERKERPPREKFDVAVANLVVHHVDSLDAFFKGLYSVLVPGGIVVITEFSTLPNGRDVAAELRAKKAEKASVDGSVNAPGAFHASFSPELIGALMNRYGFEEIGAARRGELPLLGDEGDEKVPTLYCYASKPK